jgi:hypothetical protein
MKKISYHETFNSKDYITYKGGKKLIVFFMVLLSFICAGTVFPLSLFSQIIISKCRFKKGKYFFKYEGSHGWAWINCILFPMVYFVLLIINGVSLLSVCEGNETEK